MFANPRFMRPCHGVRVPDDCHLHLYAAHLARSPEGSWWVVADRTQAAVGPGYAVENRIVISRMLPHIFHHCQVERLAGFFMKLREPLGFARRAATRSPHVVLLSPGPSSPTYFEDAYLSRYLGYSLVEGEDLTVRDNRVFLKTLGGLVARRRRAPPRDGPGLRSPGTQRTLGRRRAGPGACHPQRPRRGRQLPSAAALSKRPA